MLCQSCGKRTATTHMKQNVNGHVTERHLCGECAAKEGITGLLHTGFGLDDFWGSLFSEPTVRIQADNLRCESCGKSFAEIAESGKPGCPACYQTFYERLLPTIQRIHGKAQHIGKIPQDYEGEARQEQELKQLKEELEKAVAAQEYEKCAELRDKIRSMEEKQ